MSDDEQKRREELYAETRKDLLNRQLSNSEKFDAAILTLSTAALGVSLTFIKDIVPLAKVQDICLLKVSWWLFGFAILSTILSFVASQLGIKTQLNYAEEYYLNRKTEFLTKTNIPAKATDFCNYAAAFFFVVALLFTVIFVSTNLRGEPAMAEDKSSKGANVETKVHLKEGAPIPNMQPIKSGEIEKKGAPIPNMQPVPGSGQTQTGGTTSTPKPQPSQTDGGQKQK